MSAWCFWRTHAQDLNNSRQLSAGGRKPNYCVRSAHDMRRLPCAASAAPALCSHAAVFRIACARQNSCNQAACRSVSTRLSRSPIWFQLANVWLTSNSLRRFKESDLRVQHLPLDVTRTHQNAYGVVYEIEGPIKTPSGRIVRFCSIWQVDTGTDLPRFITMYPR